VFILSRTINVDIPHFSVFAGEQLIGSIPAEWGAGMAFSLVRNFTSAFAPSGFFV
jgi:hypothetical protein